MLTDRQTKNLPATGQPYRKRDNSADPGLRGFGVQVSAAGAKTFYVEYSFGGRRGHFYRLGSYPGMSLAEARSRCREVRKLVDDGIDPILRIEAAERAAVKQLAADHGAFTLGCARDTGKWSPAKVLLPPTPSSSR